jgi:hypothetical protein
MGSEVIIVPALFLTMGWIVHVIVDGFRRRQRLKVFTDFHGRLLERIGSAREFADFFNSDAGMRFLDSLSTESGAPHNRILLALQSGIVLVTLGIGLFILVSSWRYSIDTTNGIVLMATIASAVGAGLLISAVASYLLSRRMGLIGPRPASRDLDVTPMA